MLAALAALRPDLILIDGRLSRRAAYPVQSRTKHEPGVQTPGNARYASYPPAFLLSHGDGLLRHQSAERDNRLDPAIGEARRQGA
jgi:hypothetical protein